MHRPDNWPSIGHFENKNHWNEFIPVNSLQQLSGVYYTQDLILYQQKGYLPGFNIKDEGIAELNFVDTTLQDTVRIWSTADTGPYQWDCYKSITAIISNDQILLNFKYPQDTGGGNPFLGFSSDYVKIYKSKNRDLIIRKGTKSVGLVFILFPVFLHISDWYLYEADKQ